MRPGVAASAGAAAAQLRPRRWSPAASGADSAAARAAPTSALAAATSSSAAIHVGPLRQRLRRHACDRLHRGQRAIGRRGAPAVVAARLGVDAGQRHQRLALQLALRALLRRAAGRFGGAGARQRGVGRRGEAGVGATGRSGARSRRASARRCAPRPAAARRRAGRSRLLAVSAATDTRASCQPAWAPSRRASARPRVARQAAEQVDLPAGLQAGLQRGECGMYAAQACRSRCCAARCRAGDRCHAAPSVLRVAALSRQRRRSSVGSKRRAGPRPASPRASAMRAPALATVGAGGLGGVDQFDQQRVVQLLPPVAQVHERRLVGGLRIRMLEAIGHRRIDLRGRPRDAAAHDQQRRGAGQRRRAAAQAKGRMKGKTGGHA